MKTRPFVLVHLALAALALLGSGCKNEPTAAAQWWTVPMQLGDKTFTLEVAATREAQQTGLMFRKTMPADHGMIFVFHDESPREFWMKDTYLALDIVYLTREGKVVSIHSLEPLNRAPVPSAGPAMYAVELNRGAALGAGLKAGDKVEIPARIREIAAPPAR